MKLSQSLEGNELSDSVLTSVRDLTEKMINELCQKYNIQLAKNGRRLTEGDLKRLKPILRTDSLKIRMSISCAITPKLLEDIEMYPISSKQTVFEETEEEDDEDTGEEEEKLSVSFDFHPHNMSQTVVGPITLDELGELNDKLTDEAKFREERLNRAEEQA
jgi:ribosomal protein S13